MATLAPAAKMRRVLEFLMGLRDDRVLAALSTHGFTRSDRVLGWDLLRGLGMTQAVAPPIAMGSAALIALDEWRGRWIGVARASLAPDYPQVMAFLFRGSNKTNQGSLSVIGAFVARFERLERAKDAESKAALAKLRRRGLSSERIQEAKGLLGEAIQPKHIEAPDPDLRRSAIRKAEKELWDYFLEWGQIARAAIRDKHLLTLLGYRHAHMAADSTHESLEPEVNVTVAAAAPRANRKSKRKQKGATGEAHSRRRSRVAAVK